MGDYRKAHRIEVSVAMRSDGLPNGERPVKSWRQLSGSRSGGLVYDQALVSSVFTSTYHDTPDGRFARAGVALRRRVENGRSIWEVELPEAPGEVALSEPGGPAEPPPLVADLLRGLLRERELVQVATLQTRRSAEDASARAEVHDEVEVLEDRRVVERFEVEGEPKDPGLEVVRRRESRKAFGGKRSALPHLQTMIRRQYDEVLAHDPGTRLGNDPEALHKMRVAVRRLRAFLRVARPILDREWTDELRAELKWLGRALGTVRDHDVLLIHIRAQAETLPTGDVAALGLIVEGLERRREASREEMLEALSSPRYLELLGRIELAGEAPRWNGKRRSVQKLAAAEFKKLERAIKGLDPAPSDSELHRVRVRGKRARYAGELAEAAVGKKARRFVERAKDVQDVLGEHQDAVVAEERLRELVPSQGKRQLLLVGGRLIERQRERMLRTRAEAPKALKKLRRGGRKAWR
jgi:CHAD domain-containing protein